MACFPGLSKLNKLNKLPLVLLILTLVGGYFWGVDYGKSSVEPERIVQTEYVNHYIEKPATRVLETIFEKKVIQGVPTVEYIEVPIIKTFTEYVDRPVEKHIPIREPISVEEVQSWVDENNLPLNLIADDNGVVCFYDYKGDPRYDCDDYATDFENLALGVGLKITQIPVVNGSVWGVKVTDIIILTFFKC